MSTDFSNQTHNIMVDSVLKARYVYHIEINKECMKTGFWAFKSVTLSILRNGPLNGSWSH